MKSTYYFIWCSQILFLNPNGFIFAEFRHGKVVPLLIDMELKWKNELSDDDKFNSGIKLYYNIVSPWTERGSTRKCLHKHRRKF